MKDLKYLNKYFVKYRFKILIGFLFIVFANIFALFPAHLIGRSFNLIVEEISYLQQNSVSTETSLYRLLLVYTSLLILFALCRGVFMFFMRQTIIVVSRNIEYDLKNEIFQKYQDLSINFYNKNDSGDLLNRITEDVNRVRMYLGPAFMYSLNLLTLIILIVSRMYFVSPVLTLIVLSPLPLLSFLIYKVSHRINLKSGVVQEKLSLLTNIVQETFSGIRLVKSFVREKEVGSHFNYLSEKYMHEYIGLSRINSVFFPLVLLLVGLSVLLTVYVGGVLVVKQQITVGEVAEFIIYVNMLTWPVTSIGWVTEVVQRASASQARINEFLLMKDITLFSRSKKEAYSFKTMHADVVFSDVCYQYPGSKIMALSNININIKPDNIVGLVGGVGSGKSTIIKLISGLLEPESGKIFFNNVEFHVLNWDQFRKHIGYVSQDVFLFSDTIKNNILFSDSSVSEDELIETLKNVCLLNEIKSFNDGLDTYIGEGGVTLSGGQRQRIGLARALIKKPKLLLLDDVFSNVDSSTELKIMNYITKKLINTTIVLTSNRLSILNYCSNIFVFKSGSLIQEGSHSKLINTDGEYKKIFFNQLRSK